MENNNVLGGQRVNTFGEKYFQNGGHFEIQRNGLDSRAMLVTISFIFVGYVVIHRNVFSVCSPHPSKCIPPLRVNLLSHVESDITLLNCTLSMTTCNAAMFCTKPVFEANYIWNMVFIP